MEQLANDLVAKFPVFGDPRRKNKGAEMWYFNSAYTNGPKGFLEDRLKNQRKKIAKKKPAPSLMDEDVCSLSWESELEEGRQPQVKLKNIIKNFILLMQILFLYR